MQKQPAAKDDQQVERRRSALKRDESSAPQALPYHAIPAGWERSADHAPASLRQAAIQRLQTSAGNQSVQRLLAPQPASLREAESVIQRRLIVTGSNADFEDFRDLVEPAIGLMLFRDPVTNQVTAVGESIDPATSPNFANILTNIMDDAGQDAELQIGTAQPGVLAGAFPQPSDLTGGRVQTIDIDDIQAIETGAPGHGIAVMAHEIMENYQAHSYPIVAGVDRYAASHAEGNIAQSDVIEDLVGPGRRVADRVSPGAAPHTLVAALDFENYYLVLDISIDPATNNATIANSRQVDRIPVGTYTIDGFAVGKDAIPASGAGSIASAAADLAGNNTATARIEGFADSTGSAGVNLPLSRRRAESARAAIIAAGAGVGTGSFDVQGFGADRFVAPNDTEANRALNRRVVIMVDRPDI